MKVDCLVYSGDTAVEFNIQDGILHYGENPVRFFENDATPKYITLEAGSGTTHSGRFVGEGAKLYEAAIYESHDSGISLEKITSLSQIDPNGKYYLYDPGKNLIGAYIGKCAVDAKVFENETDTAIGFSVETIGGTSEITSAETFHLIAEEGKFPDTATNITNNTVFYFSDEGRLATEKIFQGMTMEYYFLFHKNSNEAHSVHLTTGQKDKAEQVYMVNDPDKWSYVYLYKIV